MGEQNEGHVLSATGWSHDFLPSKWIRVALFVPGAKENLVLLAVPLVSWLEHCPG